MKIFRLLVLIFTVLGGCTSYMPMHLSAGKTASDFESRTLQSPDLREFLEANLRRQVIPWPASSWDFDMLTLAALYYHPELQVARSKWEVARAGIITAGQRPNPTLSIAPQFVSNAGSGETPWVFSPTLDVPIETAGKRGYRIERARHLTQAGM